MIVFQRYICLWALYKSAQARGSQPGFSSADSRSAIDCGLPCADVSSLRWGGRVNHLLHLSSIAADKTDSKIHVRAPHQTQHE